MGPCVFVSVFVFIFKERNIIYVSCFVLLFFNQCVGFLAGTDDEMGQCVFVCVFDIIFKGKKHHICVLFYFLN